MELPECAACGHRLSSRDRSCPECGDPINQTGSLTARNEYPADGLERAQSEAAPDSVAPAHDSWLSRSPAWVLFLLAFTGGAVVLAAGVTAAAVLVGAIVAEIEEATTPDGDTEAAAAIAVDTTRPGERGENERGAEQLTLVLDDSECVTEAPVPDGWVTDTNGVVVGDAALEQAVREMIALSGFETSVAVVADSGSCTPSEFAAELRMIWGVGDPIQDDGFMVLVDRGERMIVIEPGSGARANRGMLDWVSGLGNEHFSAGDFDSGIAAILGGLASVQYDMLNRPQLDTDRTALFTLASGLNQLSFAGTARDSAGVLSLTRKEAELHQAGAAWYPKEVPIGDGFEAQFLFEIDHISWWTIGDGFAFVIQDSRSTALGEVASGNGYKGIPASLAVEFDTLYHDYMNDPWFPVPGDDPPALLSNHVAVHTSGREPNSSGGGAMIGSVGLQDTLLYDRRLHVAIVRYVPSSLSVFVDDLTVPVLTVPVDLESVLGLDDGAAYVGFTAATEPGSYSDFLVHGLTFDQCPVGVGEDERCISN